MTNPEKIDDVTWHKFGKELLNEKGSDYQRGFLVACRSGKQEFLPFVKDRFREISALKFYTVGDQRVGYGPKLTEKQFISPPPDTEEFIWNKFRNFSDEDLMSCSFWAQIIINMVEDDRIQPVFLAGQPNGETNRGASLIDSALQSGDSKKIDKCARRILRSMCNPAPRGKRIVFFDFYLGKAYWRHRWANDLSKVIDLDFKIILKVLDADYYGELAAKMHTGNSYISSENILGGLLLYLKGCSKKQAKGGHVAKIIDQLSHLSAWKAIEAQPPSANKVEIQQIAENTD